MSDLRDLPTGNLSEAEFQLKVQRFAEEHGWKWLHIPRSRVGKAWLTRARGPLAKGWFDLLLIRRERAAVAELKTKVGRMKPEQEEVAGWCAGALEVYTWRPADWPEIVGVLE